MERSIVVTDVTRMRRPRICVAGFFTDDGTQVRPIIPYEGITEGFLYSRGQLTVTPFAEVRLIFSKHVPDPPHGEDWEIDPSHRPKLIRTLSKEERQEFLRSHLDDSVGEIFGTTIEDDKYVIRGHGRRSLGTILPKRISTVSYSEKERDKWDYRIVFTDEAEREFGLAITDLTFRAACDYLMIRKGWSPDRIGQSLQRVLNQREVYLRIGLARGWEQYPDRCYLQVTGIYSFPDYLRGKTYRDLI
jgi:hypothetical protein